MMKIPKISLLPLLFLALSGTDARALPPVVPGFEQSPQTDEIFRGQILLGELSCLSCHAPENHNRISTKTAPDLREAGKRITPQFLRAFLSEPHSVKPGTTMPDLFHASDSVAKEAAVDFLVHFLVSQGGPVDSTPLGATRALVKQGEELFHSIGCIACHAPADPSGITTPIVPLGNLAMKTNLDQLTEFLLDPLKTRSSGRMPSFRLEPAEARALSVYLLEEQFDNPQSALAGPGKRPGLAFEYYEIRSPQRLPDFSQLEPRASGSVDTFTLDIPAQKRSSNFAIRFQGLIAAPEDGRYTFTTRSDDGSKLYINDALVVDNDGLHAMTNQSGEIDLVAGEHKIAVTYFQAGGDAGLNVFWSGPGIPQTREIPTAVLWNSSGEPMLPLATEQFVLDPEKIEAGRRMFSNLGCASCHHVDGLDNLRPAKSLAELNIARPDGCLSETVAKGLPNYHLSAPQRSALEAALKNQGTWEEPPSPEFIVNQTVAALNCHACHDRNGIGGPDSARAALFTTTFDIDLGEEGKIPPSLTGMGGKLKQQAIERILLHGELHVRPYMAARMPDFGEENLRPFIENIAAVDHLENASVPPEFSEESWKIGHRLAGVTGMACITCHDISGQRAIGIPGIDLAAAYDRLNPGWFKNFLLDPAAAIPGTRMPQFWPDGRSVFPDLAGGDTGRQIAGLWNYLSLRQSMPLPEGIQPPGAVGMELIPDHEPIVHRTFMKDVGPRAIVAGFPEKVHVAFDANTVRLARAWRGRFFDAAGVASGRTDAFFDPLGGDILDMPAGPAFALLESNDSPWPNPARTERNAGGRFRGYYLDSFRRPIFRYELDRVEIEEQPLPLIQAGGAILSRNFRLQSPVQPPGNLYFLAAAGSAIQEQSNSIYTVDGRLTVTLKSEHSLQPMLRQKSGRTELLVPIEFQDGEFTLETILQW